MKKLTGLLAVITVLLCLSSCGADVLSIEDYEWKMRAVMNNNIPVSQTEGEIVIAVGEDDYVHPNAKIVDILLVAKDGLITVYDTTNNKTYSGTYKVQQKTPKGTDYEITIDGNTGYATVAPTEYYGGAEEPTLPINIAGYSLYFIPA